ncbi:hypothetical protein EV426DRAFT_47259 [Tirmania nivea]|nr:hypothetical protein EV426DRAFT_47259 [Tirmania nivea]
MVMTSAGNWLAAAWSIEMFGRARLRRYLLAWPLECFSLRHSLYILAAMAFLFPGKKPAACVACRHRREAENQPFTGCFPFVLDMQLAGDCKRFQWHDAICRGYVERKLVDPARDYDFGCFAGQAVPCIHPLARLRSSAQTFVTGQSIHSSCHPICHEIYGMGKAAWTVNASRCIRRIEEVEPACGDYLEAYGIQYGEACVGDA